MKRDATSYGIEEREMNNQTANEAVRNGTEQFSFLFENNLNIETSIESLLHLRIVPLICLPSNHYLMMC